MHTHDINLHIVILNTGLNSNSEMFKGIAAASTIPAPVHGVLDSLKHKLTDLSMHICVLALM